jgi:hypothetical protein
MLKFKSYPKHLPRQPEEKAHTRACGPRASYLGTPCADDALAATLTRTVPPSSPRSRRHSPSASQLFVAMALKPRDAPAAAQCHCPSLCRCILEHERPPPLPFPSCGLLHLCPIQPSPRRRSAMFSSEFAHGKIRTPPLAKLDFGHAGGGRSCPAWGGARRVRGVAGSCRFLGKKRNE